MEFNGFVKNFLIKHSAAICRVYSIKLIRCYRFLFSTMFGNCCRFSPSCSTYAEEAIQLHGCLKGGYLIARRLIRCHPWCIGGVDPVPK